MFKVIDSSVWMVIARVETILGIRAIGGFFLVSRYLWVCLSSTGVFRSYDMFCLLHKILLKLNHFESFLESGLTFFCSQFRFSQCTGQFIVTAFELPWFCVCFVVLLGLMNMTWFLTTVCLTSIRSWPLYFENLALNLVKFWHLEPVFWKWEIIRQYWAWKTNASKINFSVCSSVNGFVGDSTQPRHWGKFSTLKPVYTCETAGLIHGLCHSKLKNGYLMWSHWTASRTLQILLSPLNVYFRS